MIHYMNIITFHKIIQTVVESVTILLLSPLITLTAETCRNNILNYLLILYSVPRLLQIKLFCMFYESRIDYELALHGWKLATLRLDRSIFIVLCNIRFSALFQVQSGERIL